VRVPNYVVNGFAFLNGKRGTISVSEIERFDQVPQVSDSELDGALLIRTNDLPAMPGGATVSRHVSTSSGACKTWVLSASQYNPLPS